MPRRLAMMPLVLWPSNTTELYILKIQMQGPSQNDQHQKCDLVYIKDTRENSKD